MADSLPPVCASSWVVFGVSTSFSPDPHPRFSPKKASNIRGLLPIGEQVRVVSDHLSLLEKEYIEKG
jgi:hypothetical protein